MEKSNGWEILESATVAAEASITEHFTGFVNSFVQKDRRERWLHLLSKRPKQIYYESHKLQGHLDPAKCSRLKDESQISQKRKGIYYGFLDEPVVLTVADAFTVSQGKDAIFSIVPGELAIYFFHEDENMLCEVRV